MQDKCSHLQFFNQDLGTKWYGLLKGNKNQRENDQASGGSCYKTFKRLQLFLPDSRTKIQYGALLIVTCLFSSMQNKCWKGFSSIFLVAVTFREPVASKDSHRFKTRQRRFQKVFESESTFVWKVQTFVFGQAKFS